MVRVAGGKDWSARLPRRSSQIGGPEEQSSPAEVGARVQAEPETWMKRKIEMKRGKNGVLTNETRVGM